MYAHAKSMLVRQNQTAKISTGQSISLTPIALYLPVRVASQPYSFCSLFSPGRRYFLNKDPLVKVCREDEGHFVTYDLSMQVFLCEIDVLHVGFVQPVTFLC